MARPYFSAHERHAASKKTPPPSTPVPKKFPPCPESLTSSPGRRAHTLVLQWWLRRFDSPNSKSCPKKSLNNCPATFRKSPHKGCPMSHCTLKTNWFHKNWLRSELSPSLSKIKKSLHNFAQFRTTGVPSTAPQRAQVGAHISFHIENKRFAEELASFGTFAQRASAGGAGGLGC